MFVILQVKIDNEELGEFRKIRLELENKDPTLSWKCDQVWFVW